MADPKRRRSPRLIDKFADSAMPKADSSDVSQRSAWWWIFLMPGKVILWIQYMFPDRIGGVFGSARRRNVPLLQLLYSLVFYLVAFIMVPLLYLYFYIVTHAR